MAVLVHCLPVQRKRPLVLKQAVWVSLFAYLEKKAFEDIRLVKDVIDTVEQ
jgi:hypothetical protein